MFRDLKKPICLITYALLLYFLLTNFVTATGVIFWVLSLFTPFFVGLIMAFILNRPYMWLRNKGLRFLDKWNKPFVPKMKKGLALLLSYMMFLLLITLCVFLLFPQLLDSGNKLVNNLYGYTMSLESTINNLLDRFNLTNDFWAAINRAVNQFTESFGKLLSDAFPVLVNLTKDITSWLANFFIGTVASIYFLTGKEKLLAQCHRTIRVFFPRKFQSRLLRVANLTNDMFGNFIIGQLINALIVGVLCFIGMSVLQLDYAVLISVLMAVCNVIPFFGALIGAIPSLFILLMVDPWQALWFAIFICLLQQIDGNVIAPKVVGDSIGLSGLWVMVSIIVSSSFAGVVGMFAGVPLFAVGYSLLRDLVRRREKQVILKERAEEAARQDPDAVPEENKPV